LSGRQGGLQSWSGVEKKTLSSSGIEAWFDFEVSVDGVD
jgi:hypothetical protein